MLIRELENETQLDRATIRFYEKEGLITPERQENGYRTYSETDVDTLLKVKLLRQLGMSLEKIKALQQGSEDFSSALAEQIVSLESLMDHAEKARQVCFQIREDAPSYESLDASYYLKLLEQPAPVDHRWKPQYVPEFHQKPLTHPWRRYFARWIDLTVLNLTILFILIVVLRIRPTNGILFDVLSMNIVLLLIMIPVEGLLIHYLGTTPGKWIMGIRIESINGGPLPLYNAMHRAWDVFRYGYGFGIPFYYIWRGYRSYKDYKDYSYVQWDYEWGAEYQFTYYADTQKKVGITALVVVYLLGMGITVADSRKPVFRGEDLTISQFAKNYNDILMENVDSGSVADAVDAVYLKDDGTWETYYKANNAIYIYLEGKPVIIHEDGSKEEGYEDFDYVVEDGFIRAVTYEQEWEEVFLLSPLNGRPLYLAYAVASSQDWWNPLSQNDFEQYITRYFPQKAGSFTYENLEFRWNTVSENCNFSEGIYYETDTGRSSVRLYFEIIIHPAS